MLFVLFIVIQLVLLRVGESKMEVLILTMETNMVRLVWVWLLLLDWMLTASKLTSTVLPQTLRLSMFELEQMLVQVPLRIIYFPKNSMNLQ